MRRMRGPVLGLVCVLVLSVAYLRGVVHVNTPNIQPFIQADMTSLSPLH